MDYSNLTGPSGGADNMGGTKQAFYFAPISYFDAIAEVAASPATLAELVEIDTAHTFLTGKGFHKMYCTMDKGSMEAAVQGERDGRSYKQSAKLFYPGSESDAHGLISQAKNDRFIVLIEMPDGKVMQLGGADFYAEITAKFSTGTNSGGVRGYEIDVESMAPRNYVYTAAITEFP